MNTDEKFFQLFERLVVAVEKIASDVDAIACNSLEISSSLESLASAVTEVDTPSGRDTMQAIATFKVD